MAAQQWRIRLQCRIHRSQSDPWVRKLPGEGKGNPFLLGNPADRGAWWAISPRSRRLWHEWRLTLQHFHQQFIFKIFKKPENVSQNGRLCNWIVSCLFNWCHSSQNSQFPISNLCIHFKETTKGIAHLKWDHQFSRSAGSNFLRPHELQASKRRP